MPLAQSGEAPEEGSDENDSPVVFDSNVVYIDVAGRVADPRNEEPVKPIIYLAGLKTVFKAPELKRGRGPNRLAVAPEPHASIESSFENREFVVHPEPNQEELSRLVGAEG